MNVSSPCSSGDPSDIFSSDSNDVTFVTNFPEARSCGVFSTQTSSSSTGTCSSSGDSGVSSSMSFPDLYSKQMIILFVTDTNPDYIIRNRYKS